MVWSCDRFAGEDKVKLRQVRRRETREIAVEGLKTVLFRALRSRDRHSNGSEAR